MTYEATLKFLYSQLPMFQRVGDFAYRANLNNTKALLNHFGNPHKGMKTVHIAGTNGKGSTSHMLASILQMSGYKTGLYTSPHLKDFRERIRVDGKMVGKMYVVNFVNENKGILKKIKPSFFEMTVAMAFKYFKEEGIDIGVIETGLGGRLDSTNVIYPEVSLITNIGLDHTAILGNTVQKIAVEKAGIIKRWATVVISETSDETKDIFMEIADHRSSKYYFADQILRVKSYRQPYDVKSYFTLEIYKGDQPYIRHLELELGGIYQAKNILGVLQTVEILREKKYKIPEFQLRKALREVKKNTGLMGRWQKLSEYPAVYCDVGHNANGITEVLKQVKLTNHKNLHVVFGMVKDKDITKVLELLPKDATYYFCKADLPRSLEPEDLKAQAATFKLKGDSYSTVMEALNAAKQTAEEEDMILVTGSTFVVAEAL
ncbi:MAG: folylpolyglutamate synthase/dihydrofolate synthase family protein [Bacteroidota bacterium]